MFRGITPVNFTNLEHLSLQESQSLLTAVQAESNELQSLRLSGKLVIRVNGRKLSTTQAIAFERPQLLRAEIFSGPVNTWSGIVIAQNGNVLSYVADEHLAYRGQVNVCSMAKVLAVPFMPDEFALWLSGKVPLPQDNNIEQSEVYRAKDGEAILRYVLRDGRELDIVLQEAKREKTTKHLVARLDILKTNSGKIIFSAERKGEEIQFDIPAKNVKGSFVPEKVIINPDLSVLRARLFNFSIPRGTTIIDLKSNSVEACLN